jgi:hypothetical protein
MIFPICSGIRENSFEEKNSYEFCYGKFFSAARFVSLAFMDWVSGAGVSGGNPGVSGCRPPTPATLQFMADKALVTSAHPVTSRRLQPDILWNVPQRLRESFESDVTFSFAADHSCTIRL